MTINLGRVSDAQLRWLYANCRALVAASYEDFGLTPIEAMSFGTPVVALRAGGYLDSVVDGVTGLFFDAPTPTDLTATLRTFARTQFDPEAIKRHAQRFSPQRFRDSIQALAETTALVKRDGRR
jgi:glycosyltransferase involved in cell wall biosynthesis